MQHIPILRENWVVSLRGRLETTLDDEDQVPARRRHLIFVVRASSHRRPRSENHPVSRKNWNVLHDLGLEPVEAVGAVLIRESDGRTRR